MCIDICFYMEGHSSTWTPPAVNSILNKAFNQLISCCVNQISITICQGYKGLQLSRHITFQLLVFLFLLSHHITTFNGAFWGGLFHLTVLFHWSPIHTGSHTDHQWKWNRTEAVLYVASHLHEAISPDGLVNFQGTTREPHFIWFEITWGI